VNIVTDRLVSAEEAPKETAMDEWYGLRGGGSDRPSVTVHMPSSLPHVYVHTKEHGCYDPPTLGPDEPFANLMIGGVTFTSRLDELELMINAAQEALDHARHEVNQIRAREEEQ
jgi:hypothetical protein